MSHAFVQEIGDKRFKFMHGHEVDPFINAHVQSIGRMIGSISNLLEFHQGTCLLSSDTAADVLLEAGEQLLRLRDWLVSGINRAFRGCYGMVPAEKARFLVRGLRTHRMLERYHADRAENLYDTAIVGHTHKAGTFSDWYFNSGSWTGSTNNFLRITPDGRIGVFDWGKRGPRPNNTVVVA
jgi:UDP-2,3-diacylglucosamine pyrophosphatase LpxH